MKNKINLLVVVLSVFVLFSCKDKQTYSKIEKTPEVTKTIVHKIVINDFMNAGGYTYLNVQEDDKEYWMAVPNTKVEKGATFYYTDGMVMKDFESKELGRKFDFITFSGGISVSEELATKPAKNPHAAEYNADTKVVEVNIAQPANGTTVGDLYSKKESLKNKEVIVRGKVVKVNKGILDRNWVHVVDGTSFETKKDITITTSQLVKVGDTVTFKATVTLDKDFGAGYVYKLLLENGEVVE